MNQVLTLIAAGLAFLVFVAIFMFCAVAPLWAMYAWGAGTLKWSMALAIVFGAILMNVLVQQNVSKLKTYLESL